MTKSRRIGVDVGGTSVKLAVMHDGRTVHTGQSRFYTRPGRAELTTAIREAAGGVELEADVCGICVPGLLSSDRSHVTLSVNVPGLMGVPLVELVCDAIGRRTGPVRVVNDAAAATRDFADRHALSGRVCAIALGTGVGAAIVDDGVLLKIEGESSGHIGQIDVSLPDCPVIGPDGGAGSLEGYLGVPALKKMYGQDLSTALARLTVNDPPIRALARAVRIIHAIYRPHVVALLGGIGVRISHLLPDLDALIRRDLTSVARPDWRLLCGDDDFHAARGAASLAAV